MSHFQRIGVIVDGQGDFAAIKARSGPQCRILKADGPRGHSVTARQLVVSSKKQVNMLAAMGCKGALLVLDFEQRSESYLHFLAALNSEIASAVFPIEVAAAVPNRMFENWYLADILGISVRAFIKPGAKQKPYEGTHGKDQLKRLFRNEISYNEVKHGPSLFKAIDFERATLNSSSFAAFYTIISKHLN
jgi:hypothetical protein